MREIKFRAWIGVSKTMVRVQEIAFYNQSIVDSEAVVYYEGSKFLLQQFTGLHDKNGKEIYEGDIVTNMDGKVGVCEYMANIGAAFVFTDKSITEGNTGIRPLGLEVCGNIYENPALLGRII